MPALVEPPKPPVEESIEEATKKLAKATRSLYRVATRWYEDKASDDELQSVAVEFAAAKKIKTYLEGGV